MALTAAELAITIKARDEASAVLKKMSGQLAEVDKQASAMSKATAAAGTALKGLAAGGAVAGVLAVAAAAEKTVGALTGGVGMASSIEQVRGRLNAFTKDGAATEKILEQIRAEADRTPFSFNAMADAAAMLLPASKQATGGLEGLIREAEILAALNPSEGLEGAAFALREALSGDFVSVMERFNIPRELINRLKDEGVPNAQIVGRALQEMGADFSLVSNLAQTTAGRFSTFQDGLGRLQAAAGEPILDALGVALDAASQALDENKEALTAAATAIGTVLADAIKGSVALMQEWGPKIKETAERLGELKDDVGDVLGVIGRFTEGALRPVIRTMGELSQRAEDTASDWRGAWAAVREVVDGAWRFLEPILRDVAAGLNRFGGEVLPELSEAWRSMTAIAQAAWDELEARIRPAVEAFGQFWQEHHAAIEAVATVAWANLKDIIALALDAIRTAVLVVLDLVQGDFDGAWDRVKQLTANAWDTLLRVLGRDLDLMAGALQAAMDGAQNLLQDAWNGILTFTGNVWAAINQTIDGALQAMQSAIAGAFAAVTENVTASTNDVRNYLGSVWAGIQGLAASAWGAVADIIVSEVQSVLGPIQGVMDAAGRIISSISTGLSGLVGAANAAANAIRSIPSAPSGGGGGGSSAGAALRPGGKPGETQSEVDNYNANLAKAGRASGGPVMAGTAYLVGEEGPELFMPGASGMIIPNGTASRLSDAVGAGGWGGGASPVVYFNLNVDVGTMIGDDKRRVAEELAPYIQGELDRAVRLKLG